MAGKRDKRRKRGKTVRMRRWLRERALEADPEARGLTAANPPERAPFQLRRGGVRRRGLARLLRAVLAHLERVLREDPWVPIPQRSCTFTFGKRSAPLPLGALAILWEKWPAATGWCVRCGGRVYATSFGGLLVVGGVSGICSECGEEHFRPMGGLSAVGGEVRPLLAQTEYYLNRGIFGGGAPGKVRPLVSLLRRLEISPPPRRADPPEIPGVVPFSRRRETDG